MKSNTEEITFITVIVRSHANKSFILILYQKHTCTQIFEKRKYLTMNSVAIFLR